MEVDDREVRGPDHLRELGDAELVRVSSRGKVTRAASTHSGRFSGTRFW